MENKITVQDINKNKDILSFSVFFGGVEEMERDFVITLFHITSKPSCFNFFLLIRAIIFSLLQTNFMGNLYSTVKT